MKTSLFDFELPPERIALHPVSPRDAAKLLVVSPEAISDRTIRHLPDLLQPGDIMVFNDTRVIPARLTGKRGEAKVEITLHKPLGGTCWRAFAKPGKRIRLGDKIIFNKEFYALVKEKHESGEIDIDFERDDWRTMLNRYGQMPLPQYIKRGSEAADKDQYQTIYAANDGAVAAPTAGLHFTESLFAALDGKGVKRVFVTLHVGAGTFKPVKAEDTDNHIMHTETAEISQITADAINETRQKGGRVVAVGTTSLRVLESAADEQGRLKAFSGETNLFITPGYTFKVIDILLTNFHLPLSTLFILVSGFAGLERMKQVYKHAVDNHYRFYSYGDACLLFKAGSP